MLDELATRFRPRRFGRGATIIEEGSQGGGLAIVVIRVLYPAAAAKAAGVIVPQEGRS